MIALHYSKKPLLLPLVSLIWEQQRANGRWWCFKIKHESPKKHHMQPSDSERILPPLAGVAVWCILSVKHILLQTTRTIVAAESPSLSPSSLVWFLFTEPKEVSMYMMCLMVTVHWLCLYISLESAHSSFGIQHVSWDSPLVRGWSTANTFRSTGDISMLTGMLF